MFPLFAMKLGEHRTHRSIELWELISFVSMMCHTFLVKIGTWEPRTLCHDPVMCYKILGNLGPWEHRAMGTYFQCHIPMICHKRNISPLPLSLFLPAKS